MPRKIIAALAFALASIAAAAAQGLPPGEARVTQIYAHPLPNLPGKSLKAVLVAPVIPVLEFDAVVSFEPDDH